MFYSRFYTFAGMKLIAYNITNLTDARYFAARGACMLGFSAELSSIEQVNAIKDWVDVPGFFIQLPDNASAEFIWEWQDRTGITTFLLSSLSEDTMSRFPDASWISFFNGVDSDIELSHLFITSEYFDAWSKRNELSDDAEVYVDFMANELSDPERMAHITGVIIKGSDEVKVGVKSFEVIDDFLDRIEVEY